MTDPNLSQIRQSLDQLELNFSESQLRPSLEDVHKLFAQRKEIHPMIHALLDGSAAARLYATILLTAIDPTAADKTLAELACDTTPIRVQHRIGHGNMLVAVRFAAASFRTTGNVDGGLVEVGAKLDAWKNEARDATLPETAVLLQLLADEPESARKLIAPLKSNENPVHRFYAACALGIIDPNEERAVLKSLLDDETPIRLLLGDIAMPFPAKDVAAALLDGRELPSDAGAASSPNSGGLLGTLRRFWGGD